MKVRLVDVRGVVETRPAVRPIRIQDLFTMSAGLSYDLGSDPIRKVLEDTGGRASTAQIVRAIAEEPLRFEPGTHWNYSLCHDVLGRLIEVFSGRTFGAYLKENLFDPIGMKDTGFDRSRDRLDRMASQYRYEESSGRAKEIAKDNSYVLGPEYESGGAGLVSSVEDYGLFVEMLCHGGTTPSGERLLADRTIDLMRTNHLDAVRMKDFDWIQKAGYGYGLGVRTMIDPALGGSTGPTGEFGWSGAAGCYALVDPESGIAAFYAQHMLNNMEPHVHPRLRNILYACIGRGST
jgi:CubicO group peptidase (beta-lactamase class C family)